MKKNEESIVIVYCCVCLFAVQERAPLVWIRILQKIQWNTFVVGDRTNSDSPMFEHALKNVFLTPLSPLTTSDEMVISHGNLTLLLVLEPKLILLLLSINFVPNFMIVACIYLETRPHAIFSLILKTYCLCSHVLMSLW